MGLFGCQHDSVTWPQRGWQKCCECGARRPYRQIGGKPGPWLTEVEVVSHDEEKEATQTELVEAQHQTDS